MDSTCSKMGILLKQKKKKKKNKQIIYDTCKPSKCSHISFSMLKERTPKGYAEKQFPKELYIVKNCFPIGQQNHTCAPSRETNCHDCDLLCVLDKTYFQSLKTF